MCEIAGWYTDGCTDDRGGIGRECRAQDPLPFLYEPTGDEESFTALEIDRWQRPAGGIAPVRPVRVGDGRSSRVEQRSDVQRRV